MIQALSKPRVVSGSRDKLRGDLQNRPSGSRWKGSASSAHRLAVSNIYLPLLGLAMSAFGFRRAWVIRQQLLGAAKGAS